MDKLCFEPVFNKDSVVLILGSFPSEKSLKEGFYYGNKNNRFWKILSQYFNEKIEDNIENKKQFLLNHNIALWDVVKATNLKGSSDENLQKQSFEVNDIENFLKINKNIAKIFCNGKTSQKLAKKYFPNIDFIYLPSTSPANVSFSKDIWFESFDQIFKKKVIVLEMLYYLC